MSAWLVWVVLPSLVACLLWALRLERRTSAIALALLALWLAWLARWIPPGGTLVFRQLVWFIQPRTVILGRVFDFSPPVDGLLFVWFLSLALWMAGLAGSQVPRALPPLAMLIGVAVPAVLSQTASAVAAVLWGGWGLTVLGLLAWRGAEAVGTLWLSIQMLLGALLWLLADVLATGGRLAPLSANALAQVTGLLVLAWWLMLSVPPFVGGWLRALEGLDTALGAFGGWLWGMGGVCLLLFWLERTPWLKVELQVGDFARLGGAFMVAVGGLAASAGERAGRWAAAAVLTVTGWTLLALGANGSLRWEAAAALWWPHALALLGLGVGLSRLGGEYQAAGQRPLAGVTVLVSLLTLAGVPFTAAFPARLGVFLALRAEGVLLVLVFLGSMAWLVPALRVFFPLLPLKARALLLDGALLPVPLLLVLWGVFPRWLIPWWQPLVRLFGRF